MDIQKFLDDQPKVVKSHTTTYGNSNESEVNKLSNLSKTTVKK